MARRWLSYRYRRYVNLAPNDPLMSLIGTSGLAKCPDVSPQSGPKRTLVRSLPPIANRRMLTRLGPAAKMPFGIHPHMLRHSTGFKLANQGVDTRSLQHYLGHKNIQHTVRYSELSPDRFRDFWKD